MMESMIGDVARAMQDDRRAEAAKQARIIEAERAHLPHARSKRLRERRAAIAHVRIALALRLAPPDLREALRRDMATQAIP